MPRIMLYNFFSKEKKKKALALSPFKYTPILGVFAISSAFHPSCPTFSVTIFVASIYAHAFNDGACFLFFVYILLCRRHVLFSLYLVAASDTR
jgi:hypothetical protein